MKIILSTALLLGCVRTGVVRGQTPGAGSPLVLAKADQTLAIVDPGTLKVLGRAPSGPDPHEVVASSDGRTAYISNYNGGGNIITVVDLVGIKTLAPIDLGPLRAPHGLTFDVTIRARSSETKIMCVRFWPVPSTQSILAAAGS